MMRWAGHITCMQGMRNAHKILVGKQEGKRSLRGPRHTWEDNTGMDGKEVRWEIVDWIHTAQDRNQWQALVNMVINLGFHKKQGIS